MLMAMRRIYLGLAIVGLVAASWLAFTAMAFAEGYWLSVAVPLTTLIPVAAGYGAARLSLDRILSARLAARQGTTVEFSVAPSGRTYPAKPWISG